MTMEHYTSGWGYMLSGVVYFLLMVLRWAYVQSKFYVYIYIYILCCFWIYLFIYLYIYIFFIYIFIYLYIYLFVYLFVFLFIYFYLFIYYIYTKHTYIYIETVYIYIYIYIYHHNYRGYIPMSLPIPICLAEPPNAKSWNLDLSWQNQCSPKPGLMIAFVDQTWSAAKSHMKVMMLSCFPTAKKCVPASRGRWPKGNHQAIDSFQMLLVKTWWFHDYLILHVLLYIYVHVYIHTCMYVCMYRAHDFWLYHVLGDQMPHHQKENSNPISLLLPPWKKKPSQPALSELTWLLPRVNSETGS